MEEPTTKPSGSKPASPSRTYSETDRSEVNTPDGLAPAVCARRLSAAFGSHTAESWFCCWLPNSGIVASCRAGERAPLPLPGPSLALRGVAQRVEPGRGAAQDGVPAGWGELGEEPGEFGPYLGIATGQLGDRPVAAEHQPLRAEQAGRELGHLGQVVGGPVLARRVQPGDLGADQRVAGGRGDQ